MFLFWLLFQFKKKCVAEFCGCVSLAVIIFSNSVVPRLYFEPFVGDWRGVDPGWFPWILLSMAKVILVWEWGGRSGGEVVYIHERELRQRHDCYLNLAVKRSRDLVVCWSRDVGLATRLAGGKKNGANLKKTKKEKQKNLLTVCLMMIFFLLFFLMIIRIEKVE